MIEVNRELAEWKYVNFDSLDLFACLLTRVGVSSFQGPDTALLASYVRSALPGFLCRRCLEFLAFKV